MSLGAPLRVLLKGKLPSDPRRIELSVRLVLDETMDFSLQQLPSAHSRLDASRRNFDMRNWPMPCLLTLLMWDQAFLMRHALCESLEHRSLTRRLTDRFLES
jgi:hypothetical protein